MFVVGILSLQGDVSEHVEMTKNAISDLGLAGDAIEVKTGSQLRTLDGLIIPGGESTTVGKLILKCGIDKEIIRLKKNSIPIMGTCAGLILIGNHNNKKIHNNKNNKYNNKNSLGLMDIKVTRNAFGRQKESFETEIKIPKIGRELYPAVFIRAPLIESVGDDVEILAEYEEMVVMARQDNLIAVAFHPELTSDIRIHNYFLGFVKT